MERSTLPSWHRCKHEVCVRVTSVGLRCKHGVRLRCKHAVCEGDLCGLLLHKPPGCNTKACGSCLLAAYACVHPLQVADGPGALQLHVRGLEPSIYSFCLYVFRAGSHMGTGAKDQCNQFEGINALVLNWRV